jgi:hypothetical protein
MIYCSQSCESVAEMAVDPTIELGVMQGIADNLKKLEGDQPATRRVLDWARSAFLAPDQRNVEVTPPPAALQMTGHPPTATQGPAQAPQAPVASESLPELYSVASPNSDADRALVVAYYLQKMKGASDLDSFSINKELRHLGYAASNITSALNSLIARKPQYAIQTHKSGSSRQARKRYRLTNEGLRAVERMLEGGTSG